MAKIILEVGDTFTYEKGFGIVIGDNTAVLVTGTNRTHWNVERGSIPEDALLTPITAIRIEARMALRGALAAVGH